ncbi:MAG: hypothetical protein ABIN94_18170, partial [Ferruginibacter sp.]
MNDLQNDNARAAMHKKIKCRSLRIPFLLFLFLSFLSFSMHAQQTVSGRVAAGDSSISGASVMVKNS